MLPMNFEVQKPDGLSLRTKLQSEMDTSTQSRNPRAKLTVVLKVLLLMYF